MPNYSQQDQEIPPEENLVAKFFTGQGWLVALLSLLFYLLTGIVVYLVESPDPQGDPPLICLYILPPACGMLVTFVVNFFLPFSTSLRRGLVANLPVLIASLILMGFISSEGFDEGNYWILLMFFLCGFYLISVILLVFFGWLGAKVSRSRHRWWKFSVVMLVITVFAYYLVQGDLLPPCYLNTAIEHIMVVI